MTLTIWLVRHGETSSNAERVFQGHLDVALNERGILQAEAVRAYLGGIVFDAVYASDLQRAFRTAEIITGDGVPVIRDADLREMHYGVLQGVRYSDAGHVLAPHGLSEAWASGAFHKSGNALPDGESLRKFRSRSTRFVRRLDSDHVHDRDAHVLVVAHGGKLAVLLTALLRLPAVSRYSFRFSNCSVTRLTRTTSSTVLDFHNLVVWDNGLVPNPTSLSGPQPHRGE